MDAGRFPWRLVVAAAAVGLAARLAFGLGYWVGEPLNRDEVEYLSLARSLASGDGYVYDEHVLEGPVEPFGRAPGYPVFLALVGGGAQVFDRVPASVKIAQAIVGALGVIAIAIVAFLMSGARGAVAAAAIAAVHPPLVWVSGYAYSEAIFWPIGLGLALAFSRLVGSSEPGGASSSEPGGFSPRGGIAVLVGILTGLAVLVRAATMPFVGLAGLWLLWKRQPAALAGFVLGLAIVFTPWTARNIAHHGRFVFIASDGGVTFWTGNNPAAIGEGDMAANPHLKFANQELRARYPDLTEEQMEPIYYREAFAWIRAHPGDWLWLMVKKVFYLVVPVGPSYTLHSPRYYAASVLSVGLLLPLAAVGLWRLGSRVRRLPGMWLLAAAAVATCLVFFPQERFRIPVLDPALILLASGVWAREGRDRAVAARPAV